MNLIYTNLTSFEKQIEICVVNTKGFVLIWFDLISFSLVEFWEVFFWFHLVLCHKFEEFMFNICISRRKCHLLFKPYNVHQFSLIQNQTNPNQIVLQTTSITFKSANESVFRGQIKFIGPTPHPNHDILIVWMLQNKCITRVIRCLINKIIFTYEWVCQIFPIYSQKICSAITNRHATVFFFKTERWDLRWQKNKLKRGSCAMLAAMR